MGHHLLCGGFRWLTGLEVGANILRSQCAIIDCQLIAVEPQRVIRTADRADLQSASSFFRAESEVPPRCFWLGEAAGKILGAGQFPIHVKAQGLVFYHRDDMVPDMPGKRLHTQLHIAAFILWTADVQRRLRCTRPQEPSVAKSRPDGKQNCLGLPSAVFMGTHPGFERQNPAWRAVKHGSRGAIARRPEAE